ncbi:MAG: hypothetical protein QOI98_1137 [Solirubrobacteraceae bacterium]|jgi:hypothetical protein|nr:hypothetical protein [Solirubrobacteraceae bacterium]
MRRAACLALVLAVGAAIAGDVAAAKAKPKSERSYVSYLKVTDEGPLIRWGFYVCLPRRATLRWQIEVRSLTTREVDRYTHFSKDRQGRNCTYYELDLRDLRSRFDPEDSYRTRVTVRYGDGRIIHSKAKPLKVTDPAAAQP